LNGLWTIKYLLKRIFNDFILMKFPIKINKAREKINGLCYMDGLVSTGNKFPYTILKINFAI